MRKKETLDATLNLRISNQTKELLKFISNITGQKTITTGRNLLIDGILKFIEENELFDGINKKTDMK